MEAGIFHDISEMSPIATVGNRIGIAAYRLAGLSHNWLTVFDLGFFRVAVFAQRLEIFVPGKQVVIALVRDDVVDFRCCYRKAFMLSVYISAKRFALDMTLADHSPFGRIVEFLIWSPVGVVLL
jgi:hypothetical protein